MRPGATRTEVIEYTCRYIAGNGIRALRVDDLVQQLGISKRTLYEMFVDKTNLVTTCLHFFQQRQAEEIEECMARPASSPLERIFRLLHLFVACMQRVGDGFLDDFRQRAEFAAIYGDSRKNWTDAFGLLVGEASQTGLIVVEPDVDHYVEQMLTYLLRLRLDHQPVADQYVFCRLLLRGCATPQGIEWIDRLRAEDIPAL